MVIRFPNYPSQVIASYFGDYKNIPFVVTEQDKGTHKTKVIDCSWEAQCFGIKPGLLIHEIDPSIYSKLSFVARDLRKEREALVDVENSLIQFTPSIMAIGSDELVLDVTKTPILRKYPSIYQIGEEIQKYIKKQHSFSNVVIGWGKTKIIAQVLARAAKQDSIVALNSEYEEFLKQRIELLPGINSEDKAKLIKMGIIRVGQIASIGRGILRKMFGRRGEYLLGVASGLDMPIITEKDKNIIALETLEKDIVDMEVLYKIFLRGVERVFNSMRERKLLTSCLIITISYGDGQKTEGKVILKKPINKMEDIADLRRRFEEIYIRRVAIRTIKIQPTKPITITGQLDLFDSPNVRWKKGLDAVGEIRSRFGFGSIQNAIYFGLKK